MKLSDLMIAHRSLPSKDVSKCTAALRSVLLRNPKLKSSEELAFRLLKEVHSFRLKKNHTLWVFYVEQGSPSGKGPPLKPSEVDINEYMDFLIKLDVPKGQLVSYLKKEDLFLGHETLLQLFQLYDKPIPLFYKDRIKEHISLVNAIRMGGEVTSEDSILHNPRVQRIVLYLLCLMSDSEKITEEDEMAFYDFAKKHSKRTLAMSFLLHEITSDEEINKLKSILYTSILPVILRMCIKEFNSIGRESVENAIATEEEMTGIIYRASSSLLNYYFTQPASLPSDEIKSYLQLTLPLLFAPLKDVISFFSEVENSVLEGPSSKYYKDVTKQLDCALFLINLKNAMHHEILQGRADPNIAEYLIQKSEACLTNVLMYLEENKNIDLLMRLKTVIQKANIKKEDVSEVLQEILNKIDRFA